LDAIDLPSEEAAREALAVEAVELGVGFAGDAGQESLDPPVGVVVHGAEDLGGVVGELVGMAPGLELFVQAREPASQMVDADIEAPLGGLGELGEGIEHLLELGSGDHVAEGGDVVAGGFSRTDFDAQPGNALAHMLRGGARRTETQAESGEFALDAADRAAQVAGGRGQEQEVVGIAERGNAGAGGGSEGRQRRIDRMEVPIAQERGEGATLNQSARAWAPEAAYRMPADRQHLLEESKDQWIGHVVAEHVHQEGMVDGIEAVGNVEVESPTERKGMGRSG
jgi:hypothetical protein